MVVHFSSKAARLVRAAGLAAVLTLVLAIAPGAMPAALAQGQPAAAEFEPRQEEPEEFPEGKGRDEAFYACVACHNFQLVAQQGMSRARWDETLTFMTERHKMPDIQGEDRELILDYLAAVFPERREQQRGWRNPFAQ